MKRRYLNSEWNGNDKGDGIYAWACYGSQFHVLLDHFCIESEKVIDRMRSVTVHSIRLGAYTQSHSIGG